jgi:hypothetical protein
MISWESAASSTRVHCARELGNRRTPEDLRQALRLAHSVPMDDPLRKESDRLIDLLSQETMKLAEAAYQDGYLQDAIAIANKIPAGIWTYRLAQRDIRRWQTTWTKAENLYKKATKQIDDRNWYGTLVTAREFFRLDNRYWQTTKYDELMRSLQANKETYEWQASTTDVEKVKPEEIDNLMKQLQKQRAAVGKTQLDKARSLAQSGNPEALQAGIAEAQKVQMGTPQYTEAQQLISTWQQRSDTTENRAQLTRAEQLARDGDIESLQAAIDAANQVNWGAALQDEANERIEEWRDRVYQLEVEERTRQLQEFSPEPLPSPDILQTTVTRPEPRTTVSPNIPITTPPPSRPSAVSNVAEPLPMDAMPSSVPEPDSAIVIEVNIETTPSQTPVRQSGSDSTSN